jgi:cobalt-zinc-cadmium efflux system membrane fusion protein
MQAENEYERVKILHQGLGEKLRLIQIDPGSVTSENMRSTISIFAPISGSVTKVFVNTGSHVTPDDPIMEIVNSEHLHLEIQVFEKDALSIKKDQKITFRVPEYSNQEFSAVVKLIGRAVDQDRTVKVHADLSGDSVYSFIPGMYVQAEILAEEVLKPALPLQAFVPIEGTTYLLELVSEDETTLTFRKIGVNPGEQYGGFAQVDLGSSAKKKKYLVGYPS